MNSGPFMNEHTRHQNVTDTHLLSVVLLKMIAAVQEAMSSHNPLLLDETLEAVQTPAVRITHQLHQTGNHTAQVTILLFCRDTNKRVLTD